MEVDFWQRLNIKLRLRELSLDIAAAIPSVSLGDAVE